MYVSGNIHIDELSRTLSVSIAANCRQLLMHSLQVVMRSKLPEMKETMKHIEAAPPCECCGIYI